MEPTIWEEMEATPSEFKVEDPLVTEEAEQEEFLEPVIILEHEEQREVFEEEPEVIDETGETNTFGSNIFNERWFNESAEPIIEWLSENWVPVVITLVVVVIFKLIFKDVRRRWFAAFMNNFTKNVDAKMEEMKKDIFASLSSVVSHDPALRKIGGLKILEVGVGTGANFPHYPDGTQLTAVDTNPHFKKYYDENRKKFPNIQAEDIIITTGEEMDMVPDNSIDVVVVTLVFCSVNDTQKLLKQILRVLVPGGKFYFYEHIKEFDDTNHGFRRKMQSILTFLGIWPFIFENCHLNRDILKAVEDTGFSKVEATRFYAPINHRIFQIIKPSLKGVAEK